ncbi:MAG: sulfatase-like hydrolase/transferase, partial [Phycisphaeraceae bacterium]|nr:sulfatase-like hydrolase/transferase [Phycisphaeraceae bacterium]
RLTRSRPPPSRCHERQSTDSFFRRMIRRTFRPHGLSAETERPNIVFLFADDLGYGDVGCYGHPYARTPNIDRLAEQGTRFEQFYVTGITCCPSRTGFMTGKFPASFARYPASYGFGDRVTVTQLLKKRGYAVGHFGKWHIGPNRENGTYGIDQIDSGGDHKRRAGKANRDTGLYSAAITFIKANRGKPFYVNVWGHISHYPVNPPQRFADRFKDVVVNETDFGPTMRGKFDLVRKLGKDVNISMRNYLGDVSSLDDEVGRILATLKNLGLEDNTIVVFSSDHGPAPVSVDEKAQSKKNYNETFKANMLGSPGPFRGGKHTQWEGGVRAPFIVRWPARIPAGRLDRDSVISGIDWLPTLCGLTGIGLEGIDCDGEDVSDAWLGRKAHMRNKPLLWRASNPKAAVAIRWKQWKMHTPRKGKGDLELYDVTRDPLEGRNLAAEKPGVVAELKKLIDAWTATLPGSYEKPDKAGNKKKRKNKRKAQ